MKKQKVYVSLVIFVLVLSLSLNVYYVFLKDKNIPRNITGFSFLDPTISTLDLETFLSVKEKYTGTYKPLKEEIQEILSETDGEFGVYFEDLEFHSWFGINETKYFTPASLLKITTVASILKEVEESELSFDEQVLLTSKDSDSGFGELYKKTGSLYTIEELIEIALIYSDNTAIKALHNYLLEERWNEARLSMGLPLISVEESAKGIELTPKQFSNVFRSLYYSGYLSRSSSNWVLSLLSQTEFKSGISAGVPKYVIVSHKIGIWINEGEIKGSVHDCGIVYANKPYILCVMSENVTIEQGNEVIEEISRTVYNYVSKND